MLTAAAWSAPAITVISAAPAFAFSGTATPTLGNASGSRSGSVSSNPSAPTNYQYWANQFLDDPELSNHAAAPVNTEANFRVDISLTGLTVTGSGTGTATMLVAVPKGFDSGLVQARPTLYPGSVSSGWIAAAMSYDSPSNKTLFTFTRALTGPGSIGDLTFAVITPGSGAGDTLFTYPTGKAIIATLTVSGSGTSSVKTINT